MHMINERTILRNSLIEIVVPELHKRGFEGNVKGNTRSYDFIRNENNSKQSIIFAFEKYGKPYFSMQIELEKTVPDKNKRNIKVGWILRPKKLFYKHQFGLKFSWINRLLRKAPTSLAKSEANEILKLLPKIDKWWLSPIDTPYIQYHEVFYKEN